MKRIFVTGIGTDVGKTVVSAILTEALQADYWKPVQSGSLENTDTHTVQALVSNPRSFFHPEAYRFEAPLSPHAAARIEDQEIELTQIQAPETENTLLIEGAGGLLVPLNDQFLILDLVKQLNCPIVVVSRNYLGSINHTLLTLETLKQHKIPVAGIIFNGEPNPESENFILNYTGVPKLFSAPVFSEISKNTIREIAATVQTKLNF